MFKDHFTIMHELSEYSSPRSRLTRMIKSGEVIQVRRGMFLNAGDNHYSVKSLAALIYGPSYISFEYALSHYGLIPERATVITSATYRKNKNRKFHTPIGDFYYFYLPTAVYPYGILREEENGQGYLIATKEKALLDTLYKAGNITSENDLAALLFDDFRIEHDRILSMNKDSLDFIAPLYRKNTMKIFINWLDKEIADAQCN